MIEMMFDIEQDQWKSLKPQQVLQFWPRSVKECLLCVRYADNRSFSTKFLLNNSYRILLRMNDENRPAIHVEVTITDFDGIYIVFNDYKITDAPLLLINCLSDLSLRYSQEEESYVLCVLEQC